MTNLLPLAVFSLLLAAGNLMFKQVGLVMRGQPLLDGFMSAARSPWLYVALTLFGSSTLLWIWILSRISLSKAYPWSAVGIAIVPLLAGFVFQERVSWTYWVGIALVIGGVLLTQHAAASH